MTDLDAARENVECAYPGASIQSVVQAHVYLEEFQKGIEAYNLLNERAPEDDRWLGVCYFQSFDDGQAQAAFERAVERGSDAARVNLAHLMRATDRADRAADELRKVDFDRLRNYDKVFFLRVKSIHEETNGNLKEALRFAEEAWRRLQGQPEFGLLAPSILAQLGILHGRIGRAQRAVWFLERGIELTAGLPQLKAQVRWATVMVAQGQLDRASEVINDLDPALVPGPLKGEIAWLNAEIAWAKSDSSAALHHYDEAITIAEQHQVTYEEFLSRLAIATILSYEGRQGFDEHLQRAQELISDRSDRLAYRFREILVMRKAGRYSVEHAMRELSETGRAFGDMGLLQEQGYVRLHLCAMKREAGNDAFQQDVDSLTALSMTLQNPHFLDRELQFVPTLRDVLLLPT